MMRSKLELMTIVYGRPSPLSHAFSSAYSRIPESAGATYGMLQ